MNYVLIHSKFIENFRATTPRERLLKRNSSDIRLTEAKVYTEIHHVTPKSLGGLDISTNLVEVLPEEHLFLHELRYKAFDNREDMLAVRFCVNGLKFASPNKDVPKGDILTKYIRNTYGFIRHNSASFRKKHGWQTEDGVRRIAASRTGQIPVIDAITGESMGCVTSDNEDYISGKLVHHTKGMVTAIEIATNKQVRITSIIYQANKHLYRILNSQTGSKNARYSGISDKEIIEYAVKLSVSNDSIVSYAKCCTHYRDLGIMLPKSLSSMRFDGKGIQEFLRRLQLELPNLVYDRYAHNKIRKVV